MLPLCAEATVLDIGSSFDEVTAEGVGVLTRCVDEGKLPPKLKKIDWWGGPSWMRERSCFVCKHRGVKKLRAACKRRGIDFYL